MEEKQISKAFLIAGLITRSLYTDPVTWETEILTTWTEEEADNKVLADELTDLNKLYSQLSHLQKFSPRPKLKKISERIFGNSNNL